MLNVNRGPVRRTFLLLLPLLTGCTAAAGVYDRVTIPPDERLAREVTIHRDAWGVPQIHGVTDAAVAFGIGYAQAEDRFEQLEDEYLRALGWSSWLHGEAMVAHDVVRAALDVESQARAEYEAEPRERRLLWDAYAAGVNYYLRMHPYRRPRLLVRYEPWMVLALNRMADGIPLDRLADVAEEVDAAGQVVHGAPPPPAALKEPLQPEAVLTWAVAPARSATGAALLLHDGRYGAVIAAHYELRIVSDEGWRFAGIALLGTPVPVAGHNAALGWVHTQAQRAPAAPHARRIDETAAPLVVAVRVNTRQGVQTRRFRVLRREHGPAGGALQRWLAMSKATSLEAFRAALALDALPAPDVMYADREGNILHLRDGVETLNPEEGWLYATAPGPAAEEGARALASRRVLEAEPAWSAEALERAAFDDAVLAAEGFAAALVHEWELLGGMDPARALRLDEAVDSLRAWDMRADTASIAATWFLLAAERLRAASDDAGAWPAARAVEQALERLRRGHGSEYVAWGRIHRLRVEENGNAPAGAGSVPMPGGPSWAGVVFHLESEPEATGAAPRLGRAGSGWMAVVELGAVPQARTLALPGQSRAPHSPHARDQHRLFASLRLKPGAPAEAAAFRAGAVASYQPGRPREWPRYER
jgi:acyl-homoserine-lactone acylase